MDERKLQLKNLKKRYLQQRRRAMWFWNALWCIFLVLFVLELGLLLYMEFNKVAPERILDICIQTLFKHLVVIKNILLFVLKYVKWFVAGIGVLFVLTWIFRNRALQKTRRYDSYLDYMTLKNTLKTEREEAKIK